MPLSPDKAVVSSNSKSSAVGMEKLSVETIHRAASELANMEKARNLDKVDYTKSPVGGPETERETILYSRYQDLEKIAKGLVKKLDAVSKMSYGLNLGA
jgi:hypothetical protein